MEKAAGVQPPPIWSLGFSPDSKRLAIKMGQYKGRYQDGRDDFGYLLVIPLDQPKTTLAQFEIRPTDESGTISWTPDGERLSVDSWYHYVIDLKKGIQCGLVDEVRWLDGSRFLIHRAQPHSIEEFQKQRSYWAEMAARNLSSDQYWKQYPDRRPAQNHPEPGVSILSVLGPGCAVESQWKLPGK